MKVDSERKSLLRVVARLQEGHMSQQ